MAALRLAKLVACEVDINSNNVHCFFLAVLDALLQTGNPPKHKDHFLLRSKVKAWLPLRDN
jgi:hypothetical protein